MSFAIAESLFGFFNHPNQYKMATILQPFEAKIPTFFHRPFTEQPWYYILYDGVFYTLLLWAIPSSLMLYWNILTLRYQYPARSCCNGTS
jgi:hypothetical protein